MANNITRCPKCNTSFRISDAHLNAAKGSVRCGSCLTIFRAKDHLIANASNADTETAKAKPLTKDKVLPAEAPTIGTDKISPARQATDRSGKKVVQPDPFEDDFSDEFKESTSRRSDTGEHDVSLFERDRFKDIEDDEVADHDDSWALDLLNSEDDDVESSRPTPEQERSKEEKAITQEFETSYSKNDTEEEHALHYPEEKLNPYADLDDDSATVNTGNFEIDDDIEIDEHIVVEEPYHALTPPPLKTVSKTHYLDAIEPEPVEFDWQRHTSFWQSKSLWTALSIVAAFGIIAQLAWIKFDTHSLIPPYRTYYAEACELLGCELPQAIDNSKIKTANLVVRSHPEFQNALIVDAVLQNTARFEQNFPTLELVFTDTQEKIVAARRLQPRDYLHGELAGRTSMPVAQPIHIAIEIEDPGKKATGYKMTIAN